MLKSIIVDTETIKNPCEDCYTRKEDACLMLWECEAKQDYFRNLQSLLAQAKPLSWLDEKVCDYYRQYPNCVNFFKPSDQTKYIPFSQFIQEQIKKQEGNHE